MQIRSKVSSGTILLELTTENGRMTLGDEAGTVELVVLASVTAALTESGVFDLEIVFPDGDVVRAAEGSAQLSPEVTRAS
jgi:hypothetical protein